MNKDWRPAKKSLGQNFLVSDGAIKRIISAVTADDGLPVFEIGPGRGALTIPLAEGGTRTSVRSISTPGRPAEDGMNMPSRAIFRICLPALYFWDCLPSRDAAGR